MSSPKISVVIIDDDKTLLEMYKKKFTLSGFRVLVADDGRSGLSLISKNKPDIILTDLVMPDNDGFAVLRMVKKDKNLANIPIIALTNLSSPGDREMAFSLGALDYWVKSNFTPKEIVEKVKDVLRKTASPVIASLPEGDQPSAES